MGIYFNMSLVKIGSRHWCEKWKKKERKHRPPRLPSNSFGQSQITSVIHKSKKSSQFFSSPLHLSQLQITGITITTGSRIINHISNMNNTRQADSSIMNRTMGLHLPSCLLWDYWRSGAWARRRRAYVCRIEISTRGG
jgi:hypothetical protein